MDYLFLSQTALFRGIVPEDIRAMLDCLGAIEKKAKKGEILFQSGHVNPYLGLVLRGSVCVENYDIWGKRSILDKLGPGQIFAEAYAYLTDQAMLVNVSAAQDLDCLLLRADRISSPCSHACAYHQKLILNMMIILAQKNLSLSRKILHTSPKTIRGRLMSYLSEQAILLGQRDFSIPFDRQQLADYLNVDRSALSNELGKMQAEELISVRKNRFTLLKP